MQQKSLGAHCSIEQLIAWQAVGKQFNLNQRRQKLRQLAGSISARRRGRGMEFEDVRAYQAGDDIRHIDWRVTARTGAVYTKQFCEEREIPILLVLDQRLPMFFGSQQAMKSVMACDIFGLLAWSGLKHGDKVGGIIIDRAQHQEIRPKKSRSHILHLLAAAANANQALNIQTQSQHHAMSMYSWLNEVKRLAKPGFKIFLISDFHDFSQDCVSLLRDISQHCECIAFKINDRLEQHGHRQAGSNLRIFDGKKQRSLASASQQQQFFSQHHAALEQALASFHIPLVQSFSDDQPMDLMQTLFLASKA